MRCLLFPAILALIIIAGHPPSGRAAPRRRLPDTASVFGQLSIASFDGSGQNSIQAMATDASGNVYMTGTTTSPDFPVHNAYQPAFAESVIMRTTDLGNTWSKVSSPLYITAVFPDPVAPQILFAGGTAGIYQSVDGGRSWRVVYPFQQGATLISLVIDPGNHLRIAAIVLFPGNPSFIRSLDGGITWTNATPASLYGDQLVVDPSGSGTLVLTNFGLYISRDWGLTFTEINAPAVGGATTVVFDPSHQGWLYVDVTAGSMGTLLLSTDFGATWTTKASPPTTFSNIQQLAVDPSVPTTLVATTADGLWLSRDGAASWTRTVGNGFPVDVEGNAPLVLLNHQCGPGGGLFAVGNASINFSPDDGVTWQTPSRFSRVNTVVGGPSCAVYIARTATSDAFVAKLSPTGSTVWATYLGGSDQDVPAGLAVDTQGNIYVAGNTYSLDFPTSAPRIGVPGRNSAFAAKFRPDGTLAYSVLIGGEANNSAFAIAVDAAQNAYLVGSTNSMMFPVTPGTLATMLMQGSYSGFLLKLSSSAAQMLGTYLSSSYVLAKTVAVGADDAPILSGLGTLPGLASPLGGTPPSYVMKLDRAFSQIV